jgi:hypothetical protein
LRVYRAKLESLDLWCTVDSNESQALVREIGCSSKEKEPQASEEHRLKKRITNAYAAEK